MRLPLSYLLVKVDARAAKLKVIVLKSRKELDGKTEETAKNRKSDVADQNYEGIDDKSTEGEIVILREGKKWEIVIRHFYIEHIEVIYRFTGDVGKAVKYSTDDKAEKEVYRISDKERAQTFCVDSREDAKSHCHCGNDKNERMLDDKMSVPEAEVACRKVRSNDSKQSSDHIGNKDEFKHSLLLEDNHYHVEVGCDITELEGQSLKCYTHKVERMVMEEKNECEE